MSFLTRTSNDYGFDTIIKVVDFLFSLFFSLKLSLSTGNVLIFWLVFFLTFLCNIFYNFFCCCYLLLLLMYIICVDFLCECVYVYIRSFFRCCCWFAGWLLFFAPQKNVSSTCDAFFFRGVSCETEGYRLIQTFKPSNPIHTGRNVPSFTLKQSNAFVTADLK